MGKKHQRTEPEQPGSGGFNVFAAVVVIALFTAIGVVGWMLFGPDLSGETTPIAVGREFVGDAPEIQRSSAADVLSDTSFDDMSAEEIALVKAEVERVFADAEFRASSDAVPGIDIVRRDGTTRASRQYRVSEGPGGGPLITESDSFFCDGPDGTIDVYRYDRTPAGVTDRYDRIAAGGQPFENSIANLDWSDVSDLGVVNIDGRSARGVELTLRTSDEGDRTVHTWFDIENARLLRYAALNSEGVPGISDYIFDWRVPPPIEPEPDLPQPPCAAALYE